MSPGQGIVSMASPFHRPRFWCDASIGHRPRRSRLCLAGMFHSLALEPPVSEGPMAKPTAIERGEPEPKLQRREIAVAASSTSAAIERKGSHIQYGGKLLGCSNASNRSSAPVPFGAFATAASHVLRRRCI